MIDTPPTGNKPTASLSSATGSYLMFEATRFALESEIILLLMICLTSLIDLLRLWSGPTTVWLLQESFYVGLHLILVKQGRLGFVSERRYVVDSY